VNLVFHPEARAEFLSAVDYYESCGLGLGYDFAAEVRSTVETIRGFPRAWPVLEGDIRRSQIRRFPYGIIYTVEDDVIFILAVMHLHREPEYWKHRF
jgi:plasmid stabilization system protein ParE